jgi:hypothetical protein
METLIETRLIEIEESESWNFARELKAIILIARMSSHVSDEVCVQNCQNVLHLLQLYTPLHAAAASGSVTVAQILVESGAEVDARNSYGNTPLHIACLNGHSSLCSELTYCGADINALNYRGQVSDKSLYYTRLVFTIATARFDPSLLQLACFEVGGGASKKF